MGDLKRVTEDYYNKKVSLEEQGEDESRLPLGMQMALRQKRERERRMKEIGRKKGPKEKEMERRETLKDKMRVLKKKYTK